MTMLFVGGYNPRVMLLLYTALYRQHTDRLMLILMLMLMLNWSWLMLMLKVYMV